MRVADLMTVNVTSIRNDEPLSNAAKIMWDCDCGAVPVIDHEDRAVGMITDRDICIATWTKDRSPSAIRVEEAMSRVLHYSTPDDSLGYAEDLMRSKQIRRIPVVDSEQKLAGIVSLADIARRGSTTDAILDQAELGAERVAHTLANICRPPLFAHGQVRSAARR